MLGDGLHPILDRTIASIHDPTASSLSTSWDQATMEGYVRSLLLSIRSGSASKPDRDMTVPAMLESLDEQIPFSYRNKYSTELQTGQSDILGPWPRLFLSMAFISTNNDLQENALIKFLELAISCGLLQDLKQVLFMKGPTIKLFSVALLSTSLDIPHGGGFDFAQYLLQQGVNPNSAYSTRTPLKRAVASKDKRAVRLLLDYDADPFASFPNIQRHSLSQVEIYDNESLAEVMVAMRVSLSRDSHVFLRTPLSLAVEAKDEVRARQLLQAGADPNLFHPKYLPPLHVAVRYSNAAMVSLLIEFRADPDLFYRAKTLQSPKTIHEKMLLNGSMFTRTPLQDAVENGQLAIAERLLQAGAGVDTRHTMQPTALQYICGNGRFGTGRIRVAKLLLEWEANVNAPPAAQPNGKTALEAAAGVGDVDLVELLLWEGAICNNPASILQGAFASGCQNLVDFLIRHFAKTDLSALDIDDNWVEYLEAAAKSGNAQLVDTILKKCADTSTERFVKLAINAMEAAVAHGNSEVLYRLLLSGVNPNADGRACRILNNAISEEYANTCFTLLMSKFATLQPDLDQPLHGEPTPLWTAVSRDNLDVFRWYLVEL